MDLTEREDDNDVSVADPAWGAGAPVVFASGDSLGANFAGSSGMSPFCWEHADCVIWGQLVGSPRAVQAIAARGDFDVGRVPGGG